MASPEAQSAPDATEAALRAAHERLLADHSLQFDLPFVGLPTSSPPPDWVIAIARFIGAILKIIGPFLSIIFWGGLALAVGLLLYILVRSLMGADLSLRRNKTKPTAQAHPVEWRPDATRAKVLLEDADRLAAQGRFAEAAHLLLYRSIDDIHGFRPALVHPALTSRDIAELESLPGSARDAFGAIARVVERSFFGGREVDAAGFAECRKAYENFAFPQVWA